MSEKILNTRIVHKHDTEANWLKAVNFTPKQGEIIVYDIDSTHTYERFKIGDGKTLVSALPFADDNKVDKVSGKGLSTNDYTTTEKNKLAGIATGANKTVVDSTLSSSSTNPVQNKVVNTAISNLSTLVGDKSVSVQISEAIAQKSDTNHEHDEYVNQNAFGKVAVGSTTIAADAAIDTLTLVAGDNITLTPDATNDKITIVAKDTVYTHPSYTARTGVPTANQTPAFGGTFNVSQPVSDATGHITAVNSRTITIPKTEATTSAAGLMSAADKTKLNGIATGANKITVDSALSASSTNPVQNKVVNTAISNLNALVGDTSVSEQIEAAQIVYVGPTQPTDPNIKVWINTAEEGTGIVPVLPRVSTINLPKASWSGSASPYSQTVSINTVTSATKIDLQPTVAQITSLQNDDIALMAENTDGTVKIYSFGGKPSSDMTMQVLLTEVSYV